MKSGRSPIRKRPVGLFDAVYVQSVFRCNGRQFVYFHTAQGSDLLRHKANMGGLVTATAHGLRRQVGTVRLDQQTVGER